MDEDTRFDRRLIDRHLSRGVVKQAEYEGHLASLADVRDLAVNPEVAAPPPPPEPAAKPAAKPAQKPAQKKKR